MNKTDPNIDYMVTVAMSVEFALFQYYTGITEKYSAFINSGHLRSRMEHLVELRNVAIRMRHRISKVFGDRVMPARAIRSIAQAVKPTLSSHYLNFTQLYLNFIHAPNKTIKMQHLTALWHHLEDLAEIVLFENCEPERLLEQKGD